MRKVKIGLFGKVVIAILLGVACGYVLPEGSYESDYKK